MAGHGSPTLAPKGGKLRVAIVAASWHDQIMTALIEGARQALDEAEIDQVSVVRVPGSFELSVACSRLTADFDAVVALGVVIRGGTPHFDYVCQAATVGLTEVSVRSGVPVGFGVLTCDNEDQARERAGLAGSSDNKGYEAAQAAVATALALQAVAPGGSPRATIRPL